MTGQGKGKFVVFEGGEGSGKSTQVRMLSEALSAEGVAHAVTKEPGGTPMASDIRSVLLRKRDELVHPQTELFLFAAARAQHVRGFVVPTVSAGIPVICDRFSASTLVYQGFARGMDEGEIRKMNEIATGGFGPDLTVLIDVPVEVGFSWAAARGETNRIDEEEFSFHEKIRKGFWRLALESPEGYLVVDGTLPAEEIHEIILREVKRTGLWKGAS